AISIPTSRYGVKATVDGGQSAIACASAKVEGGSAVKMSRRNMADDSLSLLDDPAELDLVSRPVAGQPDVREAWLAIDGLHCAACSVTIESALAPWVRSIEVNVMAGRARLVWEQQRIPLSDVLRRLLAMDYRPRPVPVDAVEAIDVTGRRRALWRA